jgi:hypothetical protein
MSRSKVAAMLAAVVALSFTVPALAGKSSPIKVAKKALGLAKKADKRSRTALKRANTANAAAQSALAKLAAPQPELTHAQDADHATSANVATHADAAGSLDGFKVLPLMKLTAQPASSGAVDYDTARAASPQIPIFSKGPLRLYAKCFGFTAGNPTVYVEVYVDTSQDGVVFAGTDSDSGNGYLNTGAAETNRILVSRDSADTPGTVNASDPKDSEFYAFAPDGTTIQGNLFLASKAGAPPAGNGAFGSSNCLIGGRIAAT